MMQKKYDTLQQAEAIMARRGLISLVPPIVALLTIETFINEPPPMSLITTETFANEPPEMSLITTETFANEPPILAKVTTEGFGGYTWNPNLIVDARKDSAFGEHINVALTFKQVLPDMSEVTLRSTPFGTLLELCYPEREHIITAPETFTDDEGIIYDAETTSLSVDFNGSYSTKIEQALVYIRRAGQ